MQSCNAGIAEMINKIAVPEATAHSQAGVASTLKSKITRTYLINNWRPVFGETGGAQASLQTRDGRPLGIDRRAVEIGGTFSTSGASGG
jgi:hypothetical protein